MKKRIPFYFLFLWCLYLDISCLAQNLVPNSSFEQHKQLPCNIIGNYLKFNTLFTDWSTANRATPDVWSLEIDPSCPNFALGTNSYFDMKPKKAVFGIQLPYSGNVMVGIATYLENRNYSEYLQVRLSNSLEKGRRYRVSFWVALANQVRYASNGLGIYLSDNQVFETNDKYLHIAAQAHTQDILSNRGQWVQLSFSIVADSSANFLVIGNFLTAKRTQTLLFEDIEEADGYTKNCAYYFIDEVSVVLDEVDYAFPSR